LNDRYFETRFTGDPRREILWRTLVQYYFQAQIPADATVLELGAGYGNFINNVRAQRRIAQDRWPEFTNHLDRAVEGHVGPVDDLSFVESNSIDFVFASNLFEHVSQDVFASVLEQLRDKLRPDGTITLMQPNYRYAFRDYFDDYTHTTVYSHVSICDFLEANSYEVLTCKPRFLPLTLKSRLKVSPFLIRMYLLSPVKPLGKQMLVRARPLPQSK
jgi:SAM-dependent methyltransferase